MISFVIPVFNEEESLEVFFGELIKVASIFKEDYEIIFVDDGSADNSLYILKTFGRKNKKVQIFSFRRNQGKSEALTLGFEKARGDYVVTLDADLQDDPREIAKLLEKLKKNSFDVACGWRKDRKDSFFKIIASKLFNFGTSFFWKLDLHDYNCGLKVFRKEAAKSLRLYGGLHRFVPLILYKEGFSVCEVPVVHRARRFGKSKYGLSKLWKDLPDIFTMLFLNKYSKRPLHFFGLVGFILFFVGFGILLYLTLNKFVGGVGIGDRPLFFLGILLVLTGFQIFFTGFLADLIINISHQRAKYFSLKYSSEDL